MDYEKKYKEALALARSYYDKDSMNAFLDTIFPELVESKDERIRKFLINILSHGTWRKEWPFGPNEVVAYLEKQKDASEAIEAIDRIDKYIDKNVANAHDMKDSNPDKKYYRGWDDALGKMAGILQDVYSGEKQKEQPKEELVYRLNGLMQDYIKEGKDKEEKEHRFKCYKLFWDALEDAEFFEQKEQKPADDKAFEEWIDGWYNEHHRDGYITMDEREFKNFCRGIKNMYAEQKPAEWSEQNKKWFDAIIKDYEESLSGDEEHDPAIQIKINLLKSLRPSWKPSEEQMKALKYVAYHILPGEKYRDVLFSLFKDLKKLM